MINRPCIFDANASSHFPASLVPHATKSSHSCTYARTDPFARSQPPDIVLLHLAGRVLEIKARGKWEPAPPKGKLTLPQPFPRESHQAYFLRVLALTYNPDTKSVDYSHWLVERKFAGERAESVIESIRAGIDLPLNPCRILNPQPEN